MTILTSGNLAAVVMGSAGNVPLNQSLLIPLGVTSPANAQQGLVFTVPTPVLASLPGLTSATGTGGVLRLPLPKAQAGSVLNATQQTAELQQTLQLPAAPQSLSTSTGPLEPPAEITSINTTQGLSLNPTLIIGPLPLIVNPANILTTNMVTPVPAQSLQGQAVTPQMLLNAQGHVIANVISNQFVPVLNRQGGPLSSVEMLQQVHTFQAITSVAPATVTPATSSALGKLPDTPSDIPTGASVGQLVSKQPRNATTEAEGINLEEIREFAKNFKIRRLSLGLTQTQVGQALSAAEGPTYSQSAICRFEKLDITPKSAQKIKPVLERWLTEAEVRHCVGVQDLTEFVGSEPSKKRKRRTSFTPQALEMLNIHFERNTHPTGQEMTEIAEQLNYDREVVRVWFCNKRQNLKNTVKRLRHNDSRESGSAE